MRSRNNNRLFTFYFLVIIGLILAGCGKSDKVNPQPVPAKSKSPSLSIPPSIFPLTKIRTTYYVSTTGNDATGIGSKEEPWRTLDKAFTQNALITRGDTILIADGTYAENSSGAGCWNISTMPRGNAGDVLIEPQNGATGNVTITGTAGVGLYDFVTSSTAYLYFRWLKFTDANNAKNAVGKINFGDFITFDACKFTVLTNSNAVNYAILSFGHASVTNLKFINCNIISSGTDDARGISFEAGTPTVNNITLTGCNINTTGHSAIFQGVTNLSFASNTCTSGPTYGGYCLQLGADNYTNAILSSGTITDNILNCASGHSMLIGGGVTSATISGNTIYGGNSLSAGHALVLKNCDRVKVENNAIYDGYNDGLYFKAATNCTAENNTIINRNNAVKTAGCLRLGSNSENNSVCSGNKITNNIFKVQAGQAIYWEGTKGDDGTNICDYNQYEFSSPTVNWGYVYGKTILGQSLQTLKNAWLTAPTAENFNDANSSL